MTEKVKNALIVLGILFAGVFLGLGVAPDNQKKIESLNSQVQSCQAIIKGLDSTYTDEFNAYAKLSGTMADLMGGHISYAAANRDVKNLIKQRDRRYKNYQNLADDYAEGCYR